MIAALRADMERYRSAGGWQRNLGFYVGAVFRVGSALHRLPLGPARAPLLVAYKAAAAPLQLLRKVEIPARTPIGAGLHLPRPYDIVLPPTVEIGRGCTLHQGVTLGLGPIPGVPKLGDDVCLMPGARVLGGVKIGDGVVIGANAVVTKDVPAGVVIASPPGTVASRGAGTAEPE